LSNSARGEVLMTWACSDTIRRPCQSEQAELVVFPGIYGWQMSMMQLWRNQGKPQQARELLAPVYDWFTEGFDTLDLIEAQALLEELAL
jgi:hypothetical protein